MVTAATGEIGGRQVIVGQIGGLRSWLRSTILTHDMHGEAVTLVWGPTVMSHEFEGTFQKGHGVPATVIGSY